MDGTLQVQCKQVKAAAYVWLTATIKANKLHVTVIGESVTFTATNCALLS